MQRRRFLATAGGAIAAVSTGCLGDAERDTPAEASDVVLTLTTTTSTYHTGLLGALNEAFEARFRIGVDAVAQGTGAAIETGRNGDADVVMVHARSLEDSFIQEGYGINRRDLMINDFVVVGPDEDPVGIEGTSEVIDSFSTIAAADAVFISRGDNSGTHAKEQEIWSAANIDPSGEWYREIGGGMGEALNQANLEEGAYTLADRATFLSMQDEIDLEILVQGPIEDGPGLLDNPYGIVAVNPGVHEHVNYDVAMAYIGFLTSIEGRDTIEDFRPDGEQLFFPTAVTEDPNFQQYVPTDWQPEDA